jgi:hypothetical protein
MACHLQGDFPGEPERYREEVPNAEVYVLDAGHFALDTKADEIAALIGEFMKTKK